MSVPFDQIPDVCWDTLDWFLGESLPPPDTADVRATAASGLIYPQAVTWAIGRASAGVWGRVFVTSFGLLAHRWRTQQSARLDSPQAATGGAPGVETSGPPKGEGRGEELPWDGPAWEDLADRPKHLLMHMHDKQRSDLTAVTARVWGHDNITDNAIGQAINRANHFLSKHYPSYSRRLSRKGGELRWV